MARDLFFPLAYDTESTHRELPRRPKRYHITIRGKKPTFKKGSVSKNDENACISVKFFSCRRKKGGRVMS